MGLTSSKENQEQERQNREKIYVRNAKQLVGGDDDYFATTLNFDDLNTEKPTKNKPVLPNFKQNNINGGSIGFESPRNRYDQFNVFDIVNNYEKQMKGGDPTAEQAPVVQAPVVKVREEVVDVATNQTSDEALDRVRNAILERLNDLGKNLNPEMNKVGGGSCGCENRVVNDSKTGGSTNLLATGPQTKLYQDDSSTSTTTSTSSASTSSSHTSSSEVGRKKNVSKSKSAKRTTKRSTKFDIEESSDSFILDTSETGTETEPELKPRGTRNKRVVHDTSNGDSSSSSSSSNSNSESKSSDDSEEGLSIFPFNSSDVKSSVSSQNFKTLRRRV